MAKYELLYTLAAKYTEPELAGVKQEITDELTKLGVSISRNDEIGKIRLAYPMQHVRHGHYVLVNFDAAPKIITNVTELLRLRSDILRHQIVRPEHDAKPLTQLADPDIRLERREMVGATVSAPSIPMSQPVSSGPALSVEEIDKKLSAIEEDITKSL